MRYKWLVLILLVAGVLRFVGIIPGYNQFHPDEQMSYFTAAAMLDEKTFIPQNGYTVKFVYPYLVPLINYIFFKYVFAPIGWITYIGVNLEKIVDGFIKIPFPPDEIKRILQLDILGPKYINTIFWARTVTAFFGVGNVFLTYLVASKIFNKKTGLIAALILAFNFRHVTNSHLGLPDIYNSFFLLLSVISSINLYKKPSKKSYIIAGIFAGLAYNAKFQFFAISPLLVAHALKAFENKSIIRNLLNSKILLSLLFIPLFTLLINPYHFIYLEETVTQTTDVALKYGMGTKRLNLFPFWYLYNIDLGPPLFVVSIFGIIFSFLKKFKYTLIVFSVVIIHSFIFYYYSTGGFHIRNIIPITPFLIIFASFFLEKVSNKIPVLFFMPLLIIIVFIPARNSIISDYYYTKTWNFNLLSDWLYDNPLDGPVASNPTDPPTGTPSIVRREFTHYEYFSIAEHLENGAKYALMNTDWVGNGFYDWMVGHPGDFGQRWNKPLNKLRNSYLGLAIEEMLQYQVFASLKPWQAPEANLILVEFPDWSKEKMKIVFENGGYFTTLKLPVKGSHLYKITVNLKAKTPLTSKNRDGFLKISTGSSNCVSARAYAGAKSMKEVYCLAPSTTTNFEFSLEIENTGNEIFANHLIVEESQDTVKIIPSKYPYIENKVELELIYPNSQANL